MCGRYYVKDDLEDEIRRVLLEQGENSDASQISEGADAERDASMSGKAGSRHDVLPSESASVIRGDRGLLKCVPMQWGFLNPVGKNLLINARAETAREKKTFRDSILRRRCVIPASGFYEWDHDRNRVEFFRDDKSPVWLAGFYDIFEGTDRFIILTTAANASMLPVHDRMPCILERDMIDDWIHDDSRIDAFLSREMPELGRYQEYRQQTLFDDL